MATLSAEAKANSKGKGQKAKIKKSENQGRLTQCLIVAAAPQTFSTRPYVEFPIRWLPGSSILKSEPLVTELAACASTVLGNPHRGIRSAPRHV